MDNIILAQFVPLIREALDRGNEDEIHALASALTQYAAARVAQANALYTDANKIFEEVNGVLASLGIGALYTLGLFSRHGGGGYRRTKRKSTKRRRRNRNRRTRKF
jgi:hypothetical protein